MHPEKRFCSPTQFSFFMHRREGIFSFISLFQDHHGPMLARFVRGRKTGSCSSKMNEIFYLSFSRRFSIEIINGMSSASSKAPRRHLCMPFSAHWSNHYNSAHNFWTTTSATILSSSYLILTFPDFLFLLGSSSWDLTAFIYYSLCLLSHHNTTIFVNHKSFYFIWINIVDLWTIFVHLNRWLATCGLKANDNFKNMAILQQIKKAKFAGNFAVEAWTWELL